MRNVLIVLFVGGLVMLFIRFTQPVSTTPIPTPSSSGLFGTAVLQTTPTPLPPCLLTLNAHELNEAGKQALKSGDLLNASICFQNAIERDSRFYEPYNNLAGIFYEQGRDDDAIRLWEQALELEAKSPDANAGLGTALAAKGEFEQGWAYYQRALELEAGYADAAWMARERLWGQRALSDSKLLREYAGQVR
ncbi:tetratricopeptide repeat protein [Candidatus Oscillochloris fontis]|uniref:tetratricopeptide repeat protein n=1 Tax=Candidatus Oscillochloris fontis TaxID=2496868 RepID=UPI0013762D3A|nr:tetratricopeptide repeat protein [Candidatus Oscillochloris fontis]